VHPERHINTVLISISESERQRVLSWELGAEYPVLCAAPLQDASRFAERTQPDAIVIDATARGVTTLHELKTNPRTRRIPVVILTFSDWPQQSQTVDSLAERYKQMGPTSVLRQPVTPERLREEIHRMLLRVAVASDRPRANPDCSRYQTPENDKHQRTPDIVQIPSAYHRAAV
jgi:CheY-like chemotaxis protein